MTTEICPDANLSIAPEALAPVPVPAPTASPATDKAPTLGLVMMVKNAAPTIQRTLDSIPSGVLSEVVIMDLGCTDGSVATLEKWAHEVTHLPVSVLQYTPATHPGSYFKDEPRSYSEPLPAALPYTGEMLLTDWSAARNIAINIPQTDYVLVLDGDDSFEGGPNLGDYMKLAVSQQTDVGFMRLAVRLGDRVILEASSWRVLKAARLRAGDIYFAGPTHERLKFPLGLTRTMSVNQGIRVLEQRDSATDTGRKGIRSFKVLWRHVHLVKDSETVDPICWFHLGQEALQRPEELGELAGTLLEKFIEKLGPIERGADRSVELGQAFTTLGLLRERAGELVEAATFFERAIAVNPDEAEQRHHLARVLRARLKSGGWNLMLARKIVDVARNATKRSNKAPFEGLHREYLLGTLYILGELHLRLSQKGEALKAIRQGLSLRPKDPNFDALERQAGGGGGHRPKKKRAS